MMNNPKRPIAVFATLLALFVGWIVFQQIEEERTVASSWELVASSWGLIEDLRKSQAEIDAHHTAQPQPACPPCPVCN